MMQALYNILVRTSHPIITSKVLEALILIINNFEKEHHIGTMLLLRRYFLQRQDQRLHGLQLQLQ
jgi:hypothetical protein